MFFRDSVNLWIGCAIYGVGMSGIFATVFTMFEKYLVVSGKATSFLMIMAGFGEMVFPILWGIMTTEEHPGYFVLINFLIIAGHCIFSAIFVFAGRKTNKSVEAASPVVNPTN
jgi:MFS family permease